MAAPALSSLPEHAMSNTPHPISLARLLTCAAMLAATLSAAQTVRAATQTATSAGAASTSASTSSSTSASTPAASTSTKAARLGTVTDVREVQVKGHGSGVGVVAGAVVGGLLGNQIGRGSGNTIATVGGAVAGGYAGNEVEKNVNKHTRFKTTVKFEDGSAHDFTLAQRYAVGARVQVSGKKVTLAP